MELFSELSFLIQKSTEDNKTQWKDGFLALWTGKGHNHYLQLQMGLLLI